MKFQKKDRQVFRVLIETYWNVKFYVISALCIFPGVLIETYWNVKMDDLFLDTYYFFVLIETYWNVKLIKVIWKDLVPGINRNILECKGCYAICCFTGIRVLIETYWNVK